MEILLSTLTNGHEIVTLKNSHLEVSIVPQANMINSSIKSHGIELLAQKAGIEGYVNNLKSFANPLLHPWANRLKTNSYVVEGKEVTFSFDGMKKDDNGYPMHGLFTAISGWNITTKNKNGSLRLKGTFKYDNKVPHYESYPFDHIVTVEYILRDNALSVVTSVNNKSAGKMPVAFGWHPHFKTNLKDVKINSDYEEIPLNMEVFPVIKKDEEKEPYTLLFKMNGSWNVDMLTEAGILNMEASNYPYMLRWNPEGADFVAVEPMTANIDPFNNEPILVDKGGSYSAVYTLTIN